MHVRVDYAFGNDGSRGPLKGYYLVAQTASGVKREQSIGGFGFGPQRIPMRGSWQFFAGGDLIGPEHKGAVTVWVEAEETNGSRSTASNTLTIYPKS
jgi:hypothetical protein